MADENILTRLGKLFQNQIVVRKTDSGQVKVKDVEFSQTALTSNFIDRYNKIHSSGYGNSAYQAKQNASAYDVCEAAIWCMHGLQLLFSTSNCALPSGTQN